MNELRMVTSIQNEDVFEDIEDAIWNGMRDSLSPLGDATEQIAKERIREAGAIWKGDLIGSFDARYTKSDDSFRVIVSNYSDHAEPIEFGAEYEEKGPPVAALIPWVESKLHGYTVPEDNLPEYEEVPKIREKAEDSALNEETTRLASLADQETIRMAFWLQQHIKRTGIDAVRFMKAAEVWAEGNADRTVAGYISARFRSL